MTLNYRKNYYTVVKGAKKAIKAVRLRLTVLWVYSEMASHYTFNVAILGSSPGTPIYPNKGLEYLLSTRLNLAGAESS